MLFYGLTVRLVLGNNRLKINFLKVNKLLTSERFSKFRRGVS